MDAKRNIGGADLSWAAYGGASANGEEAAESLPKEAIQRPGPSNAFINDLVAEQKIGHLHSSTQSSLKGKRYDLDNVVESWTDFLRVPLHPRSVLPLPDSLDLGKWGGKEAVPIAKDEIEERLRKYAEEADGLPSFQLLFDDSASAIAVAVASLIVEEYPNASLLNIPLLPHRKFEYAVNRSAAVYNASRWLSSMLETKAMILPMSLESEPWSWPQSSHSADFHFLRPRHELPFHSSAVLAAALDTVSAAWRSRRASDSFSHVLAHLG